MGRIHDFDDYPGWRALSVQPLIPALRGRRLRYGAGRRPPFVTRFVREIRRSTAP